MYLQQGITINNTNTHTYEIIVLTMTFFMAEGSIPGKPESWPYNTRKETKTLQSITSKHLTFLGNTQLQTRT